MLNAGYAAIILAAGASTRLGEPKQFLKIDDESLIHRAVRIVVEVGCEPIFVVTGAHAERVAEEVADQPIACIFNGDWKQGIGSSLRCGAETVMACSSIPVGILVLVCDQPALTTTHLQSLIAMHRRDWQKTIASRYAGRLGVPAVFAASKLPMLLHCAGDAGAREILRSGSDPALWVEFVEGDLDIDTPYDLGTLNDRKI